jgi:hypothetical protein
MLAVGAAIAIIIRKKASNNPLQARRQRLLEVSLNYEVNVR